MKLQISYYGRTYEEGKKITAWDGVAAVDHILRYNFFCSLKKSYYLVPQFGSRGTAGNPIAPAVSISEKRES